MKLSKFIDKKAFIKLIFVFILFYFSKVFRYIPIILFRLDKNNLSSEINIYLSSFSSICTLIVLLLIYRKDLIEYKKKIKNHLYQTLDESFKYYIIGVFGMMVTNIIITTLFKGSGANNEKIVQQMIDTAPYLMLVDAGILAPIIEELTFRKAYMDAFKNKWLFILTSGTIFGLMHVVLSSNNLVDYLYFIPYASLGISLAYMDYKEDSVLPSIIMHALHNTILIVLSIIV